MRKRPHQDHHHHNNHHGGGGGCSCSCPVHGEIKSVEYLVKEAVESHDLRMVEALVEEGGVHFQRQILEYVSRAGRANMVVLRYMVEVLHADVDFVLEDRAFPGLLFRAIHDKDETVAIYLLHSGKANPGVRNPPRIAGYFVMMIRYGGSCCVTPSSWGWIYY